MTLLDFTLPPGLARRLSRSPGLAWARHDAALIARIERAWWRQTRDSQDGRNDAARIAARRFIEGWVSQHS